MIHGLSPSKERVTVPRENGKSQGGLPDLSREHTKASTLASGGIATRGVANNTDARNLILGQLLGEGFGEALPSPGSLLDKRLPREDKGSDVVGGGVNPSELDVRRAWGGFMDELGKDIGGWEWFATFTFRDPENPKYPGWTKPGWNYAHRALWTWNDALLSATMSELRIPYWIAMMEYQHWRGVPHWHLLVGNTGDERRMAWVDWWFDHYGIARILPYQEELGAKYYLGKYLVKELADVVVAPRLRLLRKQPSQ